MEINIITWNVYFGYPFGYPLLNSYRLSTQLLELEKLSPDIINLQEIFSKELADQYINYFKEDYDYYYYYENNINIYYLLLFIPILFYNYNLLYIYYIFIILLYNTTIYHYLLNNNKGPLLTLWKKKKLKIINKKNIKYNEQRGDFMNIICPRQYQLLNLSIINSDKSFWVINTYLNNFPNDNYIIPTPKSCDYRKNQIKELKSKIDNLKLKNIILLGDMNFTPEMEEYNIITNKLYDCGVNSESTCLFKNYLNLNNNKKFRIDYIFLKKNDIKIIQFQSIFNRNPPLSDHLGLELTFQL